MKKLLIILSLLLAGLANCQAQYQYYSATTDSMLAFELAFANFEDNQRQPNSISYGCEGCNAAIGLGIAGMVIGPIIMGGEELIHFSSGTPSKQTKDIGLGLLIGGALSLTGGLVCRMDCYPRRKKRNR